MPTRGCPTSGRFCRKWGFLFRSIRIEGKQRTLLKPMPTRRVPHFRPVLPEVGVFSSDQCISKENSERRSNRCQTRGCPTSGRFCRKWGFSLPINTYRRKAANAVQTDANSAWCPTSSRFCRKWGFSLPINAYRRKTANAAQTDANSHRCPTIQPV